MEIKPLTEPHLPATPTTLWKADGPIHSALLNGVGLLILETSTGASCAWIVTSPTGKTKGAFADDLGDAKQAAVDAAHAWFD